MLDLPEDDELVVPIENYTGNTIRNYASTIAFYWGRQFTVELNRADMVHTIKRIR